MFDYVILGDLYFVCLLEIIKSKNCIEYIF